MSLKQVVKQWLRAHPVVWECYWRVKQEILRFSNLRYFLYDIRHVYRWMFWRPGGVEKRTLAAELLFQFHKLEKGMCMPGTKRLFGLEPAESIFDLLMKWRKTYPVTDPVCQGALGTLASYANYLEMYELDPDGRILPSVRTFLKGFASLEVGLHTPVPLAEIDAGKDFECFRRLVNARRSVRNFQAKEVPRDLIERAVELAQLSPSACNRQPCRVYVLEAASRKLDILSFQNGNRGFGHLVPLVLVITADQRCFFDATERHQPFVDGGLFSMSLCLGLTSLGLASCCLNWCVPPSNDRAVHDLMAIPDSERIVMMMAVGYPVDGCVVPRSPRRGLNEVLKNVESLESCS